MRKGRPLWNLLAATRARHDYGLDQACYNGDETKLTYLRGLGGAVLLRGMNVKDEKEGFHSLFVQ